MCTTMLNYFSNAPLGGRRQQRTDSTQVVAAIRALTRLELVIETMRRALDDLAQSRAGLVATANPTGVGDPLWPAD